MPITAIIITQGNELINGSITDTNAQYLCKELSLYDVQILEHRCLPDDSNSIASAFLEAMSKADLVISSGGIGPTEDDCTRKACALAFSCELQENHAAIDEIEKYYEKIQRPYTPAARSMGILPSIASAISNPCGSAPAFRIAYHNSMLYCFPGVPTELIALFQQEIIPLLPPKEHIPLVVGCFGAGESQLMKLIEEIPQPISYCATRLGIEVTFHHRLSNEHHQVIREALKPHLYSWGHANMIQALGELLVERAETVSTAESCTSGAIAAWITSISGASRYFLEGSAVYSNEAKMRTCAVPEEMLIEYGAVSEPVAIALAEGIRKRANSTWGISVTGIAGPLGGTPEKPVGTVHIAVAGPHRTVHKRLQLHGDRGQILQSTMGNVVFLLLQEITVHPL